MFEKVGLKVIQYARSIGINIIFSSTKDNFFKGDLDGKNIFITDLGSEENLFNMLHLIGHTVQWNLSEHLREFGNEVYVNPDNTLVQKLKDYEWEANCYGVYVLEHLGFSILKNWLQAKFEEDIILLINFYKTGEKIKDLSKVNKDYSYKKELVSKLIPAFEPKSQQLTRDGIVINFN